MSSQRGGAGNHPSPPLSNPFRDGGAPVITKASQNLNTEPGQSSEQPVIPELNAGNDEEMPESPKASSPRTKTATWIPKAPERIRVELPSHKINGEIQYMKDHVLIGKFLGFWPTEKALHGWVDSKWKPKGHVSLLLGPKGFFTAIFTCIEDKTRVFEGGPYFFNSAGLFLRDWKPRFNPDTEDLSHVPVWIRMYSLPTEYLREETLQDIGNRIGTFIKVAEETKN